MKKILSIVFAVICSFTFFSCSKENQMNNNVNNNEIVEGTKEEVKIESLNGIWKQDVSKEKDKFYYYEIEIKNDCEIYFFICEMNGHDEVVHGTFETPNEPFSKATIEVTIRVNNEQTRLKNIFYDNGILSFVPEPNCGEPIFGWENPDIREKPLPIYLELVTE